MSETCKYCKKKLATFSTVIIMEGKVEFYCSFHCFRLEMLDLFSEDFSNMVNWGIMEYLKNEKEKVYEGEE